MNKRKFLKNTVMATTGMTVVPSLVLSSCKTEPKKEETVEPEAAAATATSFVLPPLPYGYDAFPDTIDAMTMEIHHSKHHQGYTNKLNAALKEANISGKTIEEILTMDE